MPRPYWRGYLKLSLVTCPIELYPATTSAERTHFHRINKKNGHRLRQQMVDESTGRVVPQDQIGRGYELTKGRYVEVEEEELKAVKLDSTRILDIDSFAPWESIDRRYLDKPYYIVPSGETGEDAFAVIRDAMKDKGKAAIGRVVIANREHVMAIEPLGKGLLATTLRYPYEMRDEDAYFSRIKTPRVDKEMVRLAGHILDSKSAKFDPSKFKDRYEDALKAMIKRKASGKTIEAPERERPEGNVINLFDALRESVGQSAKSAKRRAPTKVRGSSKAQRGRRRAA